MGCLFFDPRRSRSPLPLRAHPRALAAGFAPYPNGSRRTSPLTPARAPPQARQPASGASHAREAPLAKAPSATRTHPTPTLTPPRPPPTTRETPPGGVRARRRRRRRAAPPGPPVPVAVPAPDRRRRRAVQRQVLRSRGDSRPRLSPEGRGDMHATSAHPAATLRRRRGEGHREVPAQARRGA